MRLHARWRRRLFHAAALGLCIQVTVTLTPATARAASSLSGQVTAANGKPIPGVPVVVLDETGEIVGGGTAGRDGRYCLEDEAFGAGHVYFVCGHLRCAPVVASALECETALAALAGESVLVGLTEGLSTTEMVAIGLGVGAAGVGLGFGIDAAVGEEEAASLAK